MPRRPLELEPPPQLDARWMNSGRAAHHLGYRQGTLRNLCAAGEMPHIKRRGRLWFWEPVLDTWKVGDVRGAFQLMEALVGELDAAEAELPRLQLVQSR